MSSTERGTWLHLNERGSKMFGHIFPDGRVPARSFLPFVQKVKLEDIGVTDVYMVNIDKLTEHQFSEIACMNAARSGESPNVIAKDIRAQGLPIRACFIGSISCSVLWFLDDEGVPLATDPSQEEYENWEGEEDGI